MASDPNTTLSGNINGGVSGTYAQPVTGLTAGPSVSLPDTVRIQFTTGTNGSYEANKMWLQYNTLAGGANTTLVLTTLVDQLNLDLNFARVKGFHVHLISTDDSSTLGSNATSILVGNHSSNQALAGNATYGMMSANSSIRVQNGGFLTIGTPSADGVLVDNTHKNLFIVNEDASNTAKFYVGFIGADS